VQATINEFLSSVSDGHSSFADSWFNRVLIILDAKEQNIKSEEWDVILERIEAIEIPDDGRVMIKADKTQLNIVVIGYKSQFMEVYNHLNIITERSFLSKVSCICGKSANHFQ
jgi:hypothetical protein